MPIGLLEKRNETPKQLERLLNDIANQIFNRCKNVEIRVFGSAFRADRRVGSDIDVCVIFKNDAAIIRGRTALYESPLCDEALDLVLLSRNEYDRMKNVGGIAFEVFHHGRKIEPQT